METLIKSRQRVQQFGEVFTPNWMVKKMLAIPEIQAAIRDPNTKFLEPCCGEGAFLTEILRQKLYFAPAKMFDALRSIFGIEIQLDNLAYARKNLAQIFADFYQLDFEDPRIWDILYRNIFHGDVLKFYKPAVQQNCFEEVFELSENPLADALKAHFNFTDEEIKRMITISNPPYHEEITNNSRKKSVYNKFMQNFYDTSDRVMVIHPARCLFDAGDTPHDFNEKLLSDEHVKVAVYHANSKEVFADAEIKGGIAVTYRDANKNFGAIGTYIPFDELKSIYQKVVVGRKDFRPLNEIMYTPLLYKFSQKFYDENPNAGIPIKSRKLSTNVFEKLPEFFTDKKPDDGHEYVQIEGIYKLSRATRFFRRDYLKDIPNLYTYKVFIPEAYGGAGALNENGPTMLVGLPLVGCTQSYTTLGAFDTEAEALAAEKYVKTKFLRALLGILKVTQHAAPETWRFVPLQDFTAGSDIDWSAAVAEIDRQLYKKYGLDAREVAFIEAKAKAME